MVEKLIIIGGGPAGLTAGIYAGRAELEPLLITGAEPGGQLMGTTGVENYPGFPEGIDGPELMQRMQEQAERFGTRTKYTTVKEADLKSDPKKIILDNDEEVEAEAVIIATGASPRKLGIPGEERLWGKGVSSCATCDGAFYKEKTVAVVGGGDSAMEESTFLTKFASKVYVIHRRDELRASKIMQKKAFQKDKIEFIWDTVVKEVLGDDEVEKLKLYNKEEDEYSELECDGFFLAIGHIPNTDLFKNQLNTEKGYIITEPHSTKTDVDGVFAAGDVRDYVFRQVVTAAGEGCRAAMEAERYLTEKE